MKPLLAAALLARAAGFGSNPFLQRDAAASPTPSPSPFLQRRGDEPPGASPNGSPASRKRKGQQQRCSNCGAPWTCLAHMPSAHAASAGARVGPRAGGGARGMASARARARR